LNVFAGFRRLYLSVHYRMHYHFNVKCLIVTSASNEHILLTSDYSCLIR